MTGNGKSGRNRDCPAGAVIVAHPDDEALWAGGTILLRPDWQWTVVALCRAADPDRAPRFARAMSRFSATGSMGDLDDGPEQTPLDPATVQATILSLTEEAGFELVLTHSPHGEYTRHLRHEETGRAVLALWESGKLQADEVWMFAYEDGGKRYPPRPIRSAHRSVRLPENIWREKYLIITEVYGFSPESFEAKAASREEAFWAFAAPAEARAWLRRTGERP